MENDLSYYLGFSFFIGIGPIRFQSLLKHFSSIKKAYLAQEKELKVILGENLAKKFVVFRSSFDPKKELEKLKKKSITVIPLSSPFYPFPLKNISDPPICLYAKGNINLFSNLNQEKLTFFAIVGTRKPTSYGEAITKIFANELAGAGLVIVSGMAIGVDSLTHWETLNSNGKTTAVLGCGVDIVYPQSNQRLYEEIIKKGGLIVSEFPPGHLVKKGLFIARNRLISGLSKGVLVVEGTSDSGALITARYAAEQGREVFAPPGPITSSMSQAPLILLKQGARLVVSPKDILEELSISYLVKEKIDILKKLNEEEKMIYSLLEKEGKTIDDLVLALNKNPSEILNLLSLMEIKSFVVKKDDGKYYLTGY